MLFVQLFLTQKVEKNKIHYVKMLKIKHTYEHTFLKTN